MATRREILAFHMTDPIQQGTYEQSQSPTLSTHRARWHTLQSWSSFRQEFEQYWAQVTEAELTTVVDETRYLQSLPAILQLNMSVLPTSERELYPIFDYIYRMLHNFAASGNVAHFHSRVQPGAARYQPIGDPDFIFEFNNVLVGIIELKTFWKVTKESIDEVIEGNLCNFKELILRHCPTRGISRRKISC